MDKTAQDSNANMCAANGSSTDSDAAEKGKAKEKSKKEARRRCLKFLEVLCLGFVLFIVCGLYSIPTVIFALPPGKFNGGSRANVSNSSSDVCLEPAVYTGATCRAELQMYQECFSGSAEDILIPSDIDQETVEAIAHKVLSAGLQFLGASEDCKAAIKPFFCLYLFTSCDADFGHHQVSVSECANLRDGVCAMEWMRATSLLGEGVLPDCKTLQSETENCKTLEENKESGSTVEMEGELISTETARNTSNFTGSENVNCSSQFYLSDTGVCRPHCGRWLPRSVQREQIESAVIIFTAIMAIMAGTCTLILAGCIQRGTVLIFPTIYVVYLGGAASIIAFVVLVGYMDRERLFCSSIDLLESINNPTPFCTISGMVYSYGLLHLTFWMFFHVVALFWGITQPFHYRKYKEYGYIKYIHITTVLVAVLVPFTPAFISLKDGYIPGRIPPIVCTGINGEITFYTLILPICILLAIASCLLILMIWTIFKEFVLKKLSSGKRINKVGKAQLRIMLILIYYIFVGVVGMMTFTYYEVTADTDVELELRAEILSNFSLAALVMVGLLPVFLLLLILDTKALRKKLQCGHSTNKK